MSHIQRADLALERGPIRAQDVLEDVHGGGFNQTLAVWVTEHVGTVWCAYVFAGIGIGSLIGVVTGNAVLALVCGAVSSYFLQLVLLPLLMVGQRVQSEHADARSEQDHALLAGLHQKVDQIQERLPP